MLGTLPFRLRRTTIAAAALEIVLTADHPLRLDRARGRVVRCTAGHAWITTPCLAEDIFLHAGESWEIPDDGRVLVEAVGTARVVL